MTGASPSVQLTVRGPPSTGVVSFTASTAPISMALPEMRVAPVWSVAGWPVIEALPASIAELPVPGFIVWV